MLSENSEEIPRKDRQMKARYAPNIPMGEREKVQSDYDVSYSNVVEPMTNAGRLLNVNKPKYTEKGEQE